ncbi:lipoprotein releasing system transmembrane protein LolC [Aquipluma nitroreducens]|uniref:Lipoprotein releasing system transmembrane protein LolC n=1 Tax=Aquipluma nitroreducens TaxID=2010828 RepID=A0A5K7S9S3_9BACT|nr:FtsX-like permease family protein [Aquipluma nitroreducens]BBE18216.1 lipoprotein releasing system transmembrane protein LolC [Aquipluma nitroreducens]
MKTAFYIARRYLISKKSVNVINIISGVSIAGVTVGTFALVVILSVFNGLDFSIKSLFSTFDPDIKITNTVKGKSFELNSIDIDKIKQIAGISTVTPIIEEDAFLMYGNRQYFATIKGVPTNYNQVSRLDTSSITSGRFLLEADHVPFALVGQGVAYYLSVGLSFTDPIHIYTLQKGSKGRPTIENTFNHNTIYASGIFANQQEIDSKYVLVPFGFAQELFQMEGRVSAIEVGLTKGVSEDVVKDEIAHVLGNQFAVKTQFEQHELFYRVMQSEKWAIFFILAFILVIASFNILGSLSMLIIDKKADIAILQSMGANQKLVRTIFLFEGWMISLAGATLGLILGVLICWIQIEFGILKIPGNDGSFIFSSYPVEIRISDLLAIFQLVTGIGFLAAWYPIRFISGKYLNGPVK